MIKKQHTAATLVHFALSFALSMTVVSLLLAAQSAHAQADNQQSSWRSNPSEFAQKVLGPNLARRPTASGKLEAIQIPEATEREVRGNPIEWAMVVRMVPSQSGPQAVLVHALQHQGESTGLLSVLPRSDNDTNLASSIPEGTAVSVSGVVHTVRAGYRPEGNIVIVVDVRNSTLRR